MKATKEAKDRIKSTIDSLLESIDREGVVTLRSWLEQSDYFTAPASTMFHGNRMGGLAKHSLAVYEAFWQKVESYGLPVSKDSAIIAGLLHDACKIDVYKTNVLKSGNSSAAKPYKMEDVFPVGHGEKSVMVVQKYFPLTAQESVLMRWHMGHNDPAWKDYQEKVEKLFPEVILFQHADKEISTLYGI